MALFKRKYVWTLGCFSVLTGCAQFYPDANLSAVKVNPVMQINQPDRSADRFYNLGRYHQRRTEYPQAIAAYQQALVIDSAYVEAHNGLGIVYAMQRQHTLSLQHFRQAIAMLPAAAWLHNNLAYALQLQQKYDEAAVVYQEALRLDPFNQKVLGNLASLDRLMEGHAAVMPEVEKVAADVAVTISPITTREPDQIGQIVQVAPNVYELRNSVPSVKAVVAAPVSIVDTPENRKKDLVISGTRSAPQNRRIEISNGNGITGLARKVANFLKQAGYPGARLTNHSHYQQTGTEIYYRPGYHDQALQVSSLLPGGAVKEIENSDLRDDVGIKILLGKDLQQAAGYFNHPGQLARQLALNSH